MKLDRIKVAFGAASITLFGILAACGGDDETPGAGSSGAPSSSSGGGSDATASGSSSGGSSSGGSSSSSGGQNSCAPAYGCYKTTVDQEGVEGNASCPAFNNVSYNRTSAPDAGPETDASVPPPDPDCTTDGSDPDQCLVKSTCTKDADEPSPGLPERVTVTEIKTEGNTTTMTITTTPTGGDACTTTIVSEMVDDALCDGDAG